MDVVHQNLPLLELTLTYEVYLVIISQDGQMTKFLELQSNLFLHLFNSHL